MVYYHSQRVHIYNYEGIRPRNTIITIEGILGPNSLMVVYADPLGYLNPGAPSLKQCLLWVLGSIDRTYMKPHGKGSSTHLSYASANSLLQSLLPSSQGFSYQVVVGPLP